MRRRVKYHRRGLSLEPHQNNSTSAVDLGSKPSASQPRSSLRSPSRNTYTDLTLLMQQHEQKIDQNQNENSIVGNKVGIASVIARPGKPRILTEGSDEEMACDGYRPDSDQTSNDEVVSPSESSNQGKATFRGGRMSKQKISLDDTLNNRPVPEMELSSSGPRTSSHCRHLHSGRGSIVSHRWRPSG